MGDEKLLTVIREFLRYSFSAISDDYSRLTPREKTICSKEEFDRLTRWSKGEGGLSNAEPAGRPWLVTIDTDISGERADDNDGWAIVNANDIMSAASKAALVFRANGISPGKHLLVYDWMIQSQSSFTTMEDEDDFSVLDVFSDNGTSVTLP